MDGRSYDELRKLGWTPQQIWEFLLEQCYEIEPEIDD